MVRTVQAYAEANGIPIEVRASVVSFYFHAHADVAIDCPPPTTCTNNTTPQRLCTENAHKGDLRGAWLEIARAVPHRTVQSIYRHGIRRLHSFKRGAWTPEEERRLVELVRAFAFLGGMCVWGRIVACIYTPKFTHVSTHTNTPQKHTNRWSGSGRSGSSCRRSWGGPRTPAATSTVSSPPPSRMPGDWCRCPPRPCR